MVIYGRECHVLFLLQSEVEGTAIVVHTSVPFGLKHLEDDVDQVTISFLRPEMHP